MNPKILIVDDDKMVTMLHKLMVERSKLGTNPKAFSDGKAALDFLNIEHDDSEHYLVLLDINMPIMNGWEFLDAVNEKSFANQLHVVMVTSSVDNGDKLKATQYPQVIGFLEKPLKIDNCNFIKTIPSVAPFFN